jgi:RNA polymerase sigma factor (sigma-70 family)
MTTNLWPGPHEKQVIAEMLENRDSAHWEKCNELMKWLIIKEAGKYSTPITADLVDEIRQNAMLSVVINLPHFRFESKLTTWLMPVARTRTIDALRLHTRNIRTNTPLNNLIEGEESEVVAYEYEMPETLEELCLASEELREVVAEISAYFDLHAKSERNRKIAKMVLLDGHTLEEAAREVGVSSAVASYVIRTLQSHLQEKFRT